MVEIACVQCNASYTAKYKSRMYCSADCAQKARTRMKKAQRKVVEFVCENCGKIGVKKKATHRFCSVSCQQEWYLQNNADTRRAAAYKWRAANPEKVRAMTERTQERNREKILARGRDSAIKRRQLYPWHPLLMGAKVRAKNAGWAYDLTIAWAKAEYTGFCAVTKLAFRPPEKRSGPSMYSPSIDRIDSALGYTQDNCRFILWAVNAMKNTGTDEEMCEIAEAILKNRSINSDHKDLSRDPALHTLSSDPTSYQTF